MAIHRSPGAGRAAPWSEISSATDYVAPRPSNSEFHRIAHLQRALQSPWEMFCDLIPRQTINLLQVNQQSIFTGRKLSALDGLAPSTFRIKLLLSAITPLMADGFGLRVCRKEGLLVLLKRERPDNFGRTYFPGEEAPDRDGLNIA